MGTWEREREEEVHNTCDKRWKLMEWLRVGSMIEEIEVKGGLDKVQLKHEGREECDVVS